MQLRRFSIFAGISILILAELACTMNIGGPAYSNRTIPVSTEAVGDLSSAIETELANGAESGQFTLKFTEIQLTSYLSYTLHAQSQPIITNPQVFLQDGKLQIYGTATQGYLQATLSMAFSVGVDEQGQLKIQLISADFGPLPVPNGLIEIATAAIQEAFTGAIGPAATGFRLLSVTIADGTMNIVGETK
jgi:hypothetical protein